KDVPSFPYNIADKVESYDGESIWTLHQGTKKEDGSLVSIFAFDCTKQKDKLPLAKNAFKKFRTIRHPDLLRYIDGVETDSYIYIVTESVTPLQTQLDAQLGDNSTLWGLYKVGSILKFLNNDCAIIHGNVRISSIFSNKSGEWKLAGFELMSSLKEESPTYGGLVHESSKYASPEISKSSWDILKDHDIWVTDSWNYGILIYEVYNGKFTSSKQLDGLGSIPRDMQASYKQLINVNPKSRLSISNFIDIGLRANGYFQNDLIQTILFLENMNIKETEEKNNFFKKLNTLIDKFPPHICKFKILPELINALEFGSGGAKVLPLIIKIGNALDDSEYESVVLSSIVKMFTVPDRTIRLSLLENLASFVNRLDNKIINDKIFPNVVPKFTSSQVTGFTDTIPIIRENTVKSILLLIPKLSDRIINNDLLRYLAKLQVDEEPGIRTNTTICLGKISKYMSESTRNKVLVPAFTRALRDPFPYARAASLMALAATLEYYDATDCATKVLPCVSAALIDKEKPVRTQAFKTADILFKRLEKLAESMPDSAIAEQNTSTASSTIVIASSVAGAAASAAESWTGWAVTSLTKKLAGSVEGEITAPPTNNATTPGKENSPNGHSLSTNSNVKSDANVEQSDQDTSDGWENGDNMFSLDSPIKELNNVQTPGSPLSNFEKKLSYTVATTSMKLGSGNKSHPTDNWGLDDEDWGNGDWEDDWEVSRPSSTQSTLSSNSTRSLSPAQKSSVSHVPSREEKQAELNRKREERKQKMAELKEKKKKGSALGAKKL
ncbi:5786_t:CDS:10, partial [Acaulospora morrowiae]